MVIPLHEGDLIVRSAEDTRDLPHYTRVLGATGIVGATDIMSIDFFPCLRQSEDFYLSDTVLATGEGLHNLTQVAALYVTDNPMLESLAGFESLETVDGYALIDRNPSLVAISLPSLEYVDRFEIGHYCGGGNTSLAELSAFGALEHFNYFGILGNPVLMSAAGLAGLGERVEAAQDPGEANLQLRENGALDIEQVLALLALEGDDSPLDINISCGNQGSERCGECPAD